MCLSTLAIETNVQLKTKKNIKTKRNHCQCQQNKPKKFVLLCSFFLEKNKTY